MVSPMQTHCKEETLVPQDSPDGGGPKTKVDAVSTAAITQPLRASPKLSTYSKMETTFDSSDKVITRETTPANPRETTFSEENDDMVLNIKPMQPIVRASPYSYMRSMGGVYSTRSVVPSLHVGVTSAGPVGPAGARLHLAKQQLQQQQVMVAATSADPLYAGALKRQAAVAAAAAAAAATMEADYAPTAADALALATGYLSDGDVLRADGRPDDIGSGYMSEGGASLYARRLHPRARGDPKDGVAARANAFFSGDSFDDSSSVSSGISDTIAEISTDDNLTGSSVSSDQTNPYASLKRTPKEVMLRGGHGAVGPKRIPSDIHGRCPSSNSNKSGNVKKSDSSQQTESSAFRQLSSSAWKKYLLDKDACGKIVETSHRLPPDKGELLRRGKSDLDPSKTRDKRAVTSGSIGVLRKSTTASGAALNGGIIETRNSGGSPKSKRKGINNSLMNVNPNGGNNRIRTSNENLCVTMADRGRMDRSSPHSNRSGSLEMQLQNRMTQGLRGMPMGVGFGYPSKRPTSTCSMSSNCSSKSAGSKVSNKRSSSDKLSDLDRLETASETASFSSESSRGVTNVTGIPRPGSAPIRSEHQYTQQQHHHQMFGSGSRGNYDNRNKSKVCVNTQTCYPEVHGQEQQCSNNGTVSDYEAGYHASSRQHHHHHQKPYAITPLISACPSSAANSAKMCSNSRGTLNSSPVPSDTSAQNSHATLGSRASPRLSMPFSKPQDTESPASFSTTSYGMLGLDHPGYSGAGAGTYPWLRHSPSAASALSRPGGGSSSGGGWLTEAESMESLASSLASSVHAHLQHARANSLTHARLLLHQRETSASPVPRLSRSNSIRSTKSEKLYPSMLQRSGDLEPYLTGSLCTSAHSPHSPAGHKAREQHQLQTSEQQTARHHHHHHHSSQPTSPTPGNQNCRAFVFPINSNSAPESSNISSYAGSALSKISSNKEDDMRGSSLSLVSTNSSLYSSMEDKQVQEIRKLRRELYEAHDKVQNLTSQLSTNKLRQAKAHVQGRKVTSSSSSTACGIPAHHLQAHVVAAFEQSLSNMTCRLQALTSSAERKDSELNELRSTIESLRKRSAEAGLTSGHLQTLQEHRMSRQLSTDSMSSINSMSSACSVASQTSGASQKSNDINGSLSKKKKKKGWLRSSFSKAFSRSKKNKNGSVSDVEDVRQLQSDTSAPNSPLLCSPHLMNGQGMKISHSSSAIYDKDEAAPEAVQELKKQLREKDMILTDIRLEALSSAHQLDSLKETVTKMRSEMMNLKEDNKRLQRMVSNKSLTSSQSSLPTPDTLEKRLSNAENTPSSPCEAHVTAAPQNMEGKRVTLSVFLGCHGDYEKHLKSQEAVAEVLIGALIVSGKMRWDMLDSFVRKSFKEYIKRTDPVSNLGLTSESIASYHLGDIIRSKDAEIPELLPCGYVIGDVSQIRITLRGTKQNSVDALAFETLIPKSIVHRYVSLLSEHRRIILCGPSGTGKTHLAHRLSEFLVLRSGKEFTPGTVATFSVDHKSAKELRQYLSNVAEQCENNASDLPSVIILDNLHHVGSLGEVFNGFLNAKYQKCPYIIGTMNQTTCSTTNLQLHHNFRWVLCANHMEPVKGFLGRYLRRKLIEHEVRSGYQNKDLVKIVDWMSKIWHHLNKFLETHSSSDVTIGPRLFLSCPNDVSGSQVWFTDLWNYSIVPYLLEAVREGLQLYGRRAAWEDPTSWVLENFPWPPDSQPNDWSSLLQLRPEDVGYDNNSSSINVGNKGQSAPTELETDPLLNMLMRLQEAASYSSPHSNDSDTTSLDSHNSSQHMEDLGGSGGGGVESTI